MLNVSNDVRRGGGGVGRVRCYGGLVTRRPKDFWAFCLSLHVTVSLALSHVSVLPESWMCRLACVAYICVLVVFPPNLSQSLVMEWFK